MKPLGAGDPVRLGPYRLLGVLGEGGMGKVYVGQDRAGVLAAVKVLRPELAHDTGLAQRFVREAHSAQAVRSKGVAAVLGAHTEGARPWIATEFLAGLTLDQVVDTYGPLGEPAVRALAASLARTLADIHAVGFVHRDLKPPNIVLTSDGPRVIDFGIARPEHGLTLTTTGQIPITPGYGAPEQVLGRRVGPPADVFSLGAVLVYAATGSRAFDGGHVAALQYEVVHGQPRLGGMAPQLQALIGPCLAKDPAARPLPAQIAQAMAAPGGAERAWRRGKIADAIKERESAARRLTTQVTVQPAGETPSVTRRRLITGLSAAGVVVAAGGGTTAWWLGTRSGTARRPGKSDPFDIPPAVRTPVQRLERQPGVDEKSYGEPDVLWSMSDVVDVYSPALLPVRDVIVFGSPGGGIAAHDVRNGKQRWTAPAIVAKGGYLSLSDRLVAGTDGDGTLRTFVASTGEPKWTCPAAEAATLLAADAEAVYVFTKDGRLRSIGRSNAEVRWTVTVPADFRKGLVTPGAIARGTLLAAASDNGSVLAVRTGDGRTAWTRTADFDPDEVVVRPAVHGGTAYLNGEALQARRLSDGELIWSAKTWRDTYWGGPKVHEDAVYATKDVYPMRLDKRDGSDLWVPERTGVSVRPMTAAATSRVAVAGHAVWAIDYGPDDSTPSMEIKTARIEEGEQVWRYGIPAFDHGRFATAGNRVFLMHDSSVDALTTF
ncbi:serine/threonine-protein kinase [Streptomyces tricolor]|uniref:Serine/threonine-protein kinase n=1 Tax=Streptomyces tricolor TaxID=68277 RepID=A0ABS9JIK7_9ACTN|nr:serine/threonine-protein kinase [Streptomyces tricolor]MCG0065385.1 serine/threonine-protein kinase [Streptomyces tricolor]